MKNYFPEASRMFGWFILFFGCIGVILLSLFSKGKILIALNHFGIEPLDEFFKLITNLGLGGILAILAVIFLFIRYYYSILFASTLVTAGILTFLLKKVIFKGMPRPAKFFDLETLPHVIKGLTYHHWGTFPSGHAMTAFAGAFVITIIAKNKRFGYWAFLIAFLVGVSRVYLCMHFFMDIFAGAMIGTFYSALLHYFLGYKLNWANNPKFNSNLIDFIYLRKFSKYYLNDAQKNTL